jgi:hypothetical protein
MNRILAMALIWAALAPAVLASRLLAVRSSHCRQQRRGLTRTVISILAVATPLPGYPSISRARRNSPCDSPLFRAARPSADPHRTGR